MPADTSSAMPVPLRSWRGGRMALLTSLALNALFIGGLVSALVRHGGPRPGPRGGNAVIGLGSYVATLPAERSRAILNGIGDKRKAMGPIRRELRQARDEALAALTAEPFDKDKYLAAQTHLIETENRQRMAQRDVLAEIAGSLTPDERRAFVRWRGAARPPGQGHPGMRPQN